MLKTKHKDIAEDERAIVTDIQAHEIAHPDFLKIALAEPAMGGLEVDFSSIDFTSRDAVLGTVKAFEDLGVAA